MWQHQRRPGTAQEPPATDAASACVYLFVHLRHAFCSVVWFNPGNTFISYPSFEIPVVGTDRVEGAQTIVVPDVDLLLIDNLVAIDTK